MVDNSGNIVIADSINGPMAVNTGPRPEENEMSIKVRYRSDIALERNINIQNGCCIYYNEHLCQRNPERQLVPLPNESDIQREGAREEIKRLTREVLKYMENGFVLEYKNRCIYVRRRCRSSIYYYSSQLTPGQDPIALKRDEDTKIFDYALFEQELRTWLQNLPNQGERTKLIRPKICFTFGQSWQPYHKHHSRGEDRPQPTAIDVCGVSMYAVPLRARDAIVSLEAGRDNSETLTMGLNSDHLFLSNEDREQCYELLEAQETRLRNCHEILDQNQQQHGQEQQQHGQQQQFLQQQQELRQLQQQELQQIQQQQQQQQQLQQQELQRQQLQQQELQRQQLGLQQLQQFLYQQQFPPQDQENYQQIQNDDGFQIELRRNTSGYDVNDRMLLDDVHDLLAGYPQPIADPRQVEEAMSYLDRL